MLYDTFVNQFIIKGVLEAVDPIHIGASAKDSLNPIEVDSSVLKDAAGNPIIPGASLKGVVRTKMESIFKGIGKRVCDIHNRDDSKCISKETDKALKKIENEKERAETAYEKSCDICKLFGGIAFAGKLHFKDAYYLGDTPCAYEHRDGVGINRDTGAAKKGVKYDFEVIPKGTRFDFVMTAENLTDDQIACLNLIIDLLCGEGLTTEDFLSVGGKTSRGLGRIRLLFPDGRENGIRKTTAEDIRKRLDSYLQKEA